MPDHFPLKGEIWAKRTATAIGKTYMKKHHVLCSNVNENSNDRCKIVSVSGKTITYILPGKMEGNNGGENRKHINTFTKDWTFQNPYIFPQRGSLWVRNNVEVPGVRELYIKNELGLGRFGRREPVVLQIIEGINTTQYDYDNGSFQTRFRMDLCTVRVYNTDEDDLPYGWKAGPGWNGVKVEVPVIDKNFITFSRQGGNSDQGTPIGYRLRRMDLSKYYTYVGIVPQYLDSIATMSNAVSSLRWRPRLTRLPRVGEIYKVKNGDLTHGQMVTSVAWSRDFRDMHAYATHDAEAMGYELVIDGSYSSVKHHRNILAAKRGPCTEYMPLFATFPFPPRMRDHQSMVAIEYDREVHYPEDKPTFIVTTVQLIKKGEEWVYWGDRALLWEIGEFEKLLTRQMLDDNHLERYRKMIAYTSHGVVNGERSAVQPADFHLSLRPRGEYTTAHMANIDYPTDKREEVEALTHHNKEAKIFGGQWPPWWVDDNGKDQRGVGGSGSVDWPRLGRMFGTVDGEINRVCEIEYSTPYGPNVTSISTFNANGKEIVRSKKNMKNFFDYNTELTSMYFDTKNLHWKEFRERRKIFLESLTHEDWEIRKDPDKVGYIMSLPSNEEGNAMLWLEGPLILLNEFRNMMNDPDLKGRVKPRTRQSYDNAIIEFIPKPAPPNNGRVRPCIHKLMTTKGYIKKDPWRSNSGTPKAFYDYIKPDNSEHLLSVGSKYKWVKDDMDSLKRNGRIKDINTPGGFPSTNEIVVLGPAFSFAYGMQLDNSNKQYSVWVQNIPGWGGDCGVYKMPVAFLLASYRYNGFRTLKFSVVNIPKAVVLNLCLIEDDSYIAKERAQFNNYDAYQVILPPNMELYKWPKTGETWHHKIVPQMTMGPAPNNKYIGRTRNMGFDNRRFDLNATNYVNWSLLSQDGMRVPTSTSYFAHNRETGSLYRFLGDYSQRITEDMSWGHKFQLFMRAKRWRVEIGSVFLNWGTGRLYHVTGINESDGKRESYNFQVLHKPTYYAFEETRNLRKDRWEITIKVEDDFVTWGHGMIFLGDAKFANWRDVDKPIIGSTYILKGPPRGDMGRSDYVKDKDGWRPLGRPRDRIGDGGNVNKIYQRKLGHLRRTTAINLNDGHTKGVTGPRNEVVILDTFEKNETVYVRFKFLLKKASVEDVVMTEVDFYYLFKWRDAELGREERPQLKSHPTFKEERKFAQARRRNMESNRLRNEKEAFSRKEYNCVICFEGTTDPSSYVLNSETNEPQGYLFTHDHHWTAEPHIICGSCAIALLKDDDSREGSYEIAQNASDDFVKGAAMGEQDNNGFPLGPIEPYKIKCPQCRIYHTFRRLELQANRNESRGSSKRDRQGGQVWGELNKLTLKF